MRLKASTFILAAGLSFGLAQMALAADLPHRPAYSEPMMVAPGYNWTGCYVGGNVGAAWGRAEVTDVNSGAGVSGTNTGFAGGGQIGCDYQMGPWVIGIRNMFDGTSLDNSATLGSGPLAGYSSNGSTHWFDTLTARGGYLVQPNVLLYAQGGVAWAQRSQTISDPTGVQVAAISNNTTGWTVGGGVEWMFVPHWSAFLEYNYMNFGTSSGSWTDTGACLGGCSVDVKADSQNVLVGVNFKF
jgi:outer membrane immunogenic protein